MPDIPHLKLPLQLHGTSFMMTEQDSDEEIADCVEAIIRCPVGFREDLPEFGMPEQTFASPSADITAMENAIIAWEPRVQALIAEDLSLMYQALERVGINLMREDET
jgi:hypothetical protein